MTEQNPENNEGKKPEMGWEHDLINRLAFASLNEQRRHRRWGIFFKFLIFAYLFALLFIAMSGKELTEVKAMKEEHTALVEVKGLISDATEANADSIIEGLRDAFEASGSKGVIMRINSPGGSPVQAAYVYDEISRLREKYPEKKLYAVIADIGASGGYYMAAAADEIYVNPSSLVGSIGVIMNGFGFVDAMEKLGVERRLMTAGENKGMLDPFSPLREEDVEHAHAMLDAIHQQFIEAVKKGRGDRLSDDKDLFSGRFWAGTESIRLGLADATGDASYVAREVIKADKLIDYTSEPDLFKRFADRLGTSMANALASKMGVTSGDLR